MEQFRYYLRVRYYECDAQKVVYNANYANYAGLATTEFLRTLAGWDLLQGDLDFMLVSQNVQWRSPARFDEVLEISVAVKEVGNSSLTIVTDFRSAGKDAVIASAETVRVLVDAKTLQKVEIPPELRRALEKGAPGVVVDHAGYLQLDDFVFS
ncbi:acyl-CoA thioesterase [Geoanaerobacter pelophilus]|nr:thioesterase family protein [Geoanaerobacter pelophilus]